MRYRFLIILYFAVFFVCIIKIDGNKDEEDAHLPILPTNFDVLIHQAYSENKYKKPTDKYISRNLYIAFREIPPPDKMYAHVKKMTEDAIKQGWMIHLLDPSMENDFMSHYYKNTSLLWAYNIIHDKSKVASSDLWRYAQLYAFGGFYIDDDSSIDQSLEKIVNKTESIILAEEGIPFVECYRNEYHLSAEYQVQLHNYRNITPYLSLYHGKSIVQWAMFWAPRNPVMYQILSSAVELIRYEYFRKSMVLNHLHQHTKLICVTGPYMMAATIREVFLSNYALEMIAKHNKNYNMIVVGRDFWDYGGMYRVMHFQAYSSRGIQYEPSFIHFRHGHIPLLSRYANLENNPL